MNRFLHIVLFTLAFTVIPLLSFPQSKNELKEKVESNQEEIQTANRILNETRKSKTSSINELHIIQKRISLRNDLISNLNSQINDIDRDIEDNQDEIKELENELKKLKENYSKIIYYAFKNHKSMDKLMFILSSETFNQAYKRYKYLHQYAEFRRKQAKNIVLKTEKIKLKVQELKDLRNRKEDIVASKKEEKAKLKNEKLSLANKISGLKSKEKEIHQQIAEKKKIVQKLEKEIERIIEEERKRTELWKNLSEDQRALSDAFEKQKGNLEWPIKNGIITQQFGENEHPVLKGVKTYNNGVDISTTQKSKVHCVFPGIARKVVSIPGANLTVIVRHGNYLTVYSNLIDVDVKPGDKINIGQVIGEVYNDKDKNESVLHLEIYKENNKMNPEAWLK